MESIAPSIHLMRFPLRLTPGIELGRNVTVIELSSGDLLIHSTAPFSAEDQTRIRSKGDPRFLLEATGFHDTEAEAGLASFPDAQYLVPPNCPALSQSGTPLQGPKIEGIPEDEITLFHLGGMPGLNEVVLLHRPSRTLLVADLLFNMPTTTPSWSRFMLKLTSGLSVGVPSMSRLFRTFGIKDAEAFRKSLVPILEEDFDQIVLGHGDPILDHGKAVLEEALGKHGFA